MRLHGVYKVYKFEAAERERFGGQSACRRQPRPSVRVHLHRTAGARGASGAHETRTLAARLPRSAVVCVSLRTGSIGVNRSSTNT